MRETPSSRISAFSTRTCRVSSCATLPLVTSRPKNVLADEDVHAWFRTHRRQTRSAYPGVFRVLNGNPTARFTGSSTARLPTRLSNRPPCHRLAVVGASRPEGNASTLWNLCGTTEKSTFSHRFTFRGATWFRSALFTGSRCGHRADQRGVFQDSSSSSSGGGICRGRSVRQPQLVSQLRSGRACDLR